MIVKNIGFVSTRFAGTDGVTLESSKWAEIIKKNGHCCFWFAVELEREPDTEIFLNKNRFSPDKIIVFIYWILFFLYEPLTKSIVRLWRDYTV